MTYESNTPLAAAVGRAREWLTNIQTSVENITGRSQPADIGNVNVELLQSGLQAVEGKLQLLLDRISNLESHVFGSNLSLPSTSQNGTKGTEDDVDLFGSDSEDDEAAKEVQRKRLADYEAKKSKKPVLIAKSNVVLDIKPWGNDTDMKALEQAVRQIKMDGLVWGASKLVPLAYGIYKLQISIVIEDDKVSVDALQEEIEAIEEYVQSMDIAAFNKV